MVASIRATMEMAIPHTVATVTDRAELAAWDRAVLGRNQRPALVADFDSLISQLNPRAGPDTSARREPKSSRSSMEPRGRPRECEPSTYCPRSRRTVPVVGVIIIICVASAAWWAWRSVSLELTAVYDEGFRKAGLPEEPRPPPRRSWPRPPDGSRGRLVKTTGDGCLVPRSRKLNYGDGLFDAREPSPSSRGLGDG
jgi:hypothetical protein